MRNDHTPVLTRVFMKGSYIVIKESSKADNYVDLYRKTDYSEDNLEKLAWWRHDAIFGMKVGFVEFIIGHDYSLNSWEMVTDFFLLL